jgi:protein deglycase
MKKVLLLLAKGFETYEASVFIDIIGWYEADYKDSIKLFACGLLKEVVSSFNVTVFTDYIINEINVEDYDALAIPGGFEEYGFYEDAYSEKFLNLIKEFYKQQKYIVSICVGALPIAKSGIMKGKNGTTYNMNNSKRPSQLKEFGVNFINQPIVIDDKIITSWNPSTAIDVALKLLELLTTKGKSDNIKLKMGFR